MSTLSFQTNFNKEHLSQYYKFHSKIYDATRWLFLFGRKGIIKHLKTENIQPNIILEVGCGTGKNLIHLTKQFPKAIIIGMDLSDNMLDIAKEKLKDEPCVFLLNQPFNQEDFLFKGKIDLIVFSYVLTMNKDYNHLIAEVKKTLKKDGHIAIVDFHDSKINIFKKWMQFNHVIMNDELLKSIKNNFQTQSIKIRKGIFPFWSYFSYIGKITLND